jgi:protein-arginine kinase activator protein McsA
MICPNCKYEYGYNLDKQEYIEPDKGDFFRHPILIERERKYGREQRQQIYACPKCGMLFIEA